MAGSIVDGGVAGNAPMRCFLTVSLATCRTRMIVERSTPASAAACAIVVSPRTSCSQISYFADGDRIFFARRCLGIEASFVLIVHPPQGVTKTLPMWSDPPPQTGHERSTNSRTRVTSVRSVQSAPRRLTPSGPPHEPSLGTHDATSWYASAGRRSGSSGVRQTVGESGTKLWAGSKTSEGSLDSGSAGRCGPLFTTIRRGRRDGDPDEGVFCSLTSSSAHRQQILTEFPRESSRCSALTLPAGRLRLAHGFGPRVSAVAGRWAAQDPRIRWAGVLPCPRYHPSREERSLAMWWHE